MKIFVDADSCPRLVRDLVLRTAKKRRIETVFAANRQIPGIEGGFAVMELCGTEADAADNRIVELAQKGDIVITRDVPLANRLVERELAVLDDRGRVYTKENIREYLSIRNFTVNLAENGFIFDRKTGYSKKELKTFADNFDKILSGRKFL
jgi:uncharacterized protein YaiI (UPF0178 family)